MLTCRMNFELQMSCAQLNAVVIHLCYLNYRIDLICFDHVRYTTMLQFSYIGAIYENMG